MKKMLIAATILLTASLIVCGMVDPSFPLMWLANTSVPFEAIRGVLVVLLMVLLFSHPPRALYVRYSIAAVSVFLFTAVVAMMLNYQINFIDIIDFLEVAVIFAVEALESPSELPVVAKRRKLAAAK